MNPRQYRLLYDFPGDLALECHGGLVPLCDILVNLLLHHVCHERVDVRWSVGHVQIDLLRTHAITTQGSIVLQAITCPVLMHREIRFKRERIPGFKCSVQLHTRSQTLPWVVSLEPPLRALQMGRPHVNVHHRTLREREYTNVEGLGRAIIDVFQSFHNPVFTFVERRLVIPVQICDVDFEPS